MTKDWKKQSFQQSKANLFAAMQYHTEEEVGRVVLQLLRADERCDDLEDFVRGINMRLLIDLQKGAKAIPVEAVPAINMEQESLRLRAEQHLNTLCQVQTESFAYIVAMGEALRFLLRNLPEFVYEAIERDRTASAVGVGDETYRSLHCESCGEWLAQGTKAELEATASAFLRAHECKGKRRS